MPIILSKCFTWIKNIIPVILLFLAFVGCDEDVNDAAKSTGKEITAFYLVSPDVTGVISDDMTITMTAPYYVEKTNLKVFFTTTGEKVVVGGTVQQSGITANNFSDPLIYTVIAQDGTSQDYTITIQLRTYSLREQGPGGGWICYENPNYKSNGWRYLEAAPGDTGVAMWGTYNYSVGAYGISNGTGKVNTQSIVAGDPSAASVAARICDDYTTTVNGTLYDDWFLPSLHELNCMYANLQKLGAGNFSVTNYMTSSEVDNEYNWIMYFGTTGEFAGLQDPEAFKDDKYRVRPCRMF